MGTVAKLLERSERGNEESGKAAIRRNHALQCVLAHRDPREIVPSLAGKPAFVCPCCLKSVTPALRIVSACSLSLTAADS